MNQASGKHSISLALALVSIAVLTIISASYIDKPSLGNDNEPGPTAFPIALAALLLAGGIHELLSWWKTKPSSSAANRTRSKPPTKVAGTSVPEGCVSGSSELSAQSTRLPSQGPLTFIAALIIYLPALHWLGFFISTLILATGLAWRLGSRLWVAAVSSLCLLLIVKLLFGVVFKVPLPPGPFGF